MPGRRDRVSRRRWAAISPISWTGSVCSGRFSPDTIGAGAPPASSRRCGRSAPPDCYGVAPGDPALDTIEGQLARQPPITVPTIALQGEADGVSPPDRTDGAARHFTGPYQSRIIPRAGHFLPREAPEAVVQAISEL